jgi:hypothetical protein
MRVEEGGLSRMMFHFKHGTNWTTRTTRPVLMLFTRIQLQLINVSKVN